MHMRIHCYARMQVSGADALLASRSSDASIAQAGISNCTFRNNSATNGGGVFFSAACQNGMLQACQSLSLSGSGTRMLENIAMGGSGAGVWVTEVGGMCAWL